MGSITVNDLRGLELAVYNLDESADFYAKAWALEPVAREGSRMFLRGAGAEHHVVTLHEAPRAGLVAINFAAPSREAVDALHAAVKAMGGEIISAPHELEAVAGGGYGFELRSPDGHMLRISSDVARHANVIGDPTRPVRLNHVVLNSTTIDNEMKFFLDVLGFKFSDNNGFMNFIRCSANHHAVAIAKSHGPSLNHAAFEMQDIENLMAGVGRMRLNDHEVGWGVGKHAGPGRNVFSYFVDPNGFAIEYTTGVEQVDDSYKTNMGDFWQAEPLKPCAWAGDKTIPHPWMREAMQGLTVETRNASCDDVISKKMAS